MDGPIPLITLAASPMQAYPVDPGHVLRRFYSYSNSQRSRLNKKIALFS